MEGEHSFVSSLHGKISADEEVRSGEGWIWVPKRISALDPEPRQSSICRQKYMPEVEGFLSDQKEKLGKPDARQNIPQFSQVKFAAQFNMLVPNEGFPHTLQGTIILVLMSMC